MSKIYRFLFWKSYLLSSAMYYFEINIAWHFNLVRLHIRGRQCISRVHLALSCFEVTSASIFLINCPRFHDIRFSLSEKSSMQLNVAIFLVWLRVDRMWTESSEELIPSVFRVENHPSKTPAFSRWLELLRCISLHKNYTAFNLEDGDIQNYRCENINFFML
jgi:hypothetical protein